jgi:hypothetical protein
MSKPYQTENYDEEDDAKYLKITHLANWSSSGGWEWAL